MADERAAKTGARKARASGAHDPASGFTDEEKAAMREYAREVRAARSRKGSKKGSSRADGEKDLRAKVAEMEPSDRALAERLHALVTEVAPELEPRTWYGMPAYAAEGKVLCFLQPGRKFKTRYATLGFSDAATLDDGAMWPTSYALDAWTDEVEAAVRALLLRALQRS